MTKELLTPVEHPEHRAEPDPDPKPCDEPERLADRAWCRHVDLPDLPHEELADLVEAFVRDESPRLVEETAAVAALAFSCIPDRASFLDGAWITTALADVYAYYTGPGFGPARTLALIERVFDWMRARGDLDGDEHARLLAKSDEAREGAGLPRKRPEVRIEPSYPHGIEELVACFVREADLSPLSRRIAPRALEVLESALAIDRGPVIFGRLRPSLLAVVMTSETEEEREADRQMAAVWGCFYRWLGATGRMDAARARALERELLRHALAPAPRAA